MNKHTAGPWNVDQLEDGMARVQIPGAGTAIVKGYDSEENARLIAAAPDMLEALRQIVWKLERKEEKIALVNHAD
jgi:hypothetical protein